MNDEEYISKDVFIAQQRKRYCENCERRKGIKNGKWISVYEIGEVPCRACDIGDMINAVWDILPADVAPVVHGHWVKDSDIDYGCSACGRRQLWMNATVYEYCPHCGAKMDESEEKQ